MCVRVCVRLCAHVQVCARVQVCAHASVFVDSYNCLVEVKSRGIKYEATSLFTIIK